MSSPLDGYSEMPRTVLVMGGNWDKTVPDNQLVLSSESKLRVLALGALCDRGLVDAAIFTAGLRRGPDNTPESTVQDQFFRDEFPKAGKVVTLEEDLGHTTKWDAFYTKQVVKDAGLKGPYTLLSTKAFLRRQTKVFEREGFVIGAAVAAEPLVASLSPEYAAQVEQYYKTRHRKFTVAETLLRGLQVIDPESHITEFLAARSRPNRGAA